MVSSKRELGFRSSVYSMIDATPSDKVSDITRKIPNSGCYDMRDVFVTLKEEFVLRRSDEVKALGISVGSILRGAGKFRGGGKHKEKKGKTEKKRVTGQESVSGVGPVNPESEKRE